MKLATGRVAGGLVCAMAALLAPAMAEGRHWDARPLFGVELHSVFTGAVNAGVAMGTLAAGPADGERGAEYGGPYAGDFRGAFLEYGHGLDGRGHAISAGYTENYWGWKSYKAGVALIREPEENWLGVTFQQGFAGLYGRVAVLRNTDSDWRAVMAAGVGW